MKNLIITAVMATVALGATAQGRFEVEDMGNYKLHTYYTNDVMNDACFIIEGTSGLVTVEAPLLKDNVSEWDSYLEKLGKKLDAQILSYHVGGTNDQDLILPEGMPAYMQGERYSNMMSGFKQRFGDTMRDMPTSAMTEVPFGEEQQWAGVSFVFNHGSKTDFPAAAILIGGNVLYTHWTPSRSHANRAQGGSVEAIDEAIRELEIGLNAGARIFVGSHGGAATREVAQFKVDYLKKMKELKQQNSDAESFAKALIAAYPGLDGENGVAAVAESLYK